MFRAYLLVHFSLQVIGETLEVMAATRRGEEKAWINCHKPGLQGFLPIPISIPI